MSFNSEDEDSINKKIGKKKYLPFGTSSSQHHPYSEYVHLNNPQAQSFAKTLATAAIEKIEILEDKPKRLPKRLLKSPGKTSNPGKSGGDEEDSKQGIPDAVGLEPCIKLGCQLILRALSDQQYANEIEREDIEDDYERLLIDLSEAEKEITVADKKLLNLNDIQRQLEQRNDQLLVKVEELENIKETQKNENSDLNNKIMIHQTEKSKLLRILEKSQKTLADAKWRKKKQEQDQDVESGLSLMGGSIISDRPIKKMDRSTISSVSSIYSTSYNRLASSHVLDHIEQPSTVKTIPKYVIKELSSAPQRFDKYAKEHYKHLADSGLKDWSRSMEGSLTTANINSPATFGSSFDTIGLSYDEYTHADDHFTIGTTTATLSLTRGSDQQQQPHRLLSSSTMSTTAASNRVGNLLKSRSDTVTTNNNNNTNSSSRNNVMTQHQQQLSKSIVKVSKRHKKNQIRLLPLENNVMSNNLTPSKSVLPNSTTDHSYTTTTIAMADEYDSSYGNNSFQDPDGLLKKITSTHNSVSSPSNLSALSFDELSHSTSLASTSHYSRYSSSNNNKLDPVFYKEKHRTSWGRGNPIGKIRTSEVTWGMQSYQNDQYNNNNSNIIITDNKTTLDTEIVSYRKVVNNNAVKSAAHSNQILVKTRSLTVYHPNMHTFKDSLHLQPTAMIKNTDSLDSDDSI